MNTEEQTDTTTSWCYKFSHFSTTLILDNFHYHFNFNSTITHDICIIIVFDVHSITLLACQPNRFKADYFPSKFTKSVNICRSVIVFYCFHTQQRPMADGECARVRRCVRSARAQASLVIGRCCVRRVRAHRSSECIYINGSVSRQHGDHGSTCCLYHTVSFCPLCVTVLCFILLTNTMMSRCMTSRSVWCWPSGCGAGGPDVAISVLPFATSGSVARSLQSYGRFSTERDAILCTKSLIRFYVIISGQLWRLTINLLNVIDIKIVANINVFEQLYMQFYHSVCWFLHAIATSLCKLTL